MICNNFWNITLIIILIILFLFIYIYVKKENFDGQIIETQTTPTVTPQPTAQKPISVQLRNEIGRVLEISPLRVNNLIYEGNIKLNTLNVDFDILDANINQNVLNEISKDIATKNAVNLVKNDNFFVKINNKTIILRVIQKKKLNWIIIF